MGVTERGFAFEVRRTSVITGEGGFALGATGGARFAIGATGGAGVALGATGGAGFAVLSIAFGRIGSSDIARTRHAENYTPRRKAISYNDILYHC